MSSVFKHFYLSIRIVNITGQIWYWDEEICVRPFSFKPLSLHGLLLFKKATMKKEGFGKKRLLLHFPFFLCPSPKWVLPFMTLLSPFLPNSFSIQHSGLQPLISVCSPAISHTPPSFPERGWVLVWELLFPLDFSSWQPICKILWPKGSCSPETVMLILRVVLVWFQSNLLPAHQCHPAGLVPKCVKWENLYNAFFKRSTSQPLRLAEQFG